MESMRPDFTHSGDFDEDGFNGNARDRRTFHLGVRADAIALLSRFVRGEISSHELVKSVRHLSANAMRSPLRKKIEEPLARLGTIGGLEELVEHLELKTSDYARVQLDRARLCSRLQAYLDADVSHRQLSDWVLELHHVYCHPQYRASDFYERDLEFSLMLLALFLDLDIAENPRHTRNMITRLLRSLRRNLPVPLEFLLGRYFAGKQHVHLVTRELHPHPEETWREAQWTELVLVSKPTPAPFATTDPYTSDSHEIAEFDVHPFDTDNRADGGISDGAAADPQHAQEPAGWFVPMVVCTESLWREGAPHDSWAHRENDRVLALKEIVPHQIPVYGCRYFFDPEGLVEVVVDKDELHLPEVEAAVRLFCYANEVQSCTLNGTHVFPAEEEQ